MKLTLTLRESCARAAQLLIKVVCVYGSCTCGGSLCCACLYNINFNDISPTGATLDSCSESTSPTKCCTGDAGYLPVIHKAVMKHRVLVCNRPLWKAQQASIWVASLISGSADDPRSLQSTRTPTLSCATRHRTLLPCMLMEVALARYIQETNTSCGASR